MRLVRDKGHLYLAVISECSPEFFVSFEKETVRENVPRLFLDHPRELEQNPPY